MDDSLHSLELRHLEPALVMQYARKVNSIETAHLTGMPEEKVRNLLVLEQKLIRWFIEERDALDSTGGGRSGEGDGGLADELQLATDRAEVAEEELRACKEALRAERDAHETLRSRHEHVADEADVLNQTVTALREELAANYESSADEVEAEQTRGGHAASPGKVRGANASSPKKHGSPSGRRGRKDEWGDESDSYAHRGEGEDEQTEETSLSEYSESERDESDSEYDRRRRRRRGGGGGGRSKRRGGEREGDRDRDFTKSRREADRIDRAAERTQRMMRGWLVRRRFRQYVRDIAMGKNVTFTDS